LIGNSVYFVKLVSTIQNGIVLRPIALGQQHGAAATRHVTAISVLFRTVLDYPLPQAFSGA
jgi:hypothetical protein